MTTMADFIDMCADEVLLLALHGDPEAQELVHAARCQALLQLMDEGKICDNPTWHDIDHHPPHYIPTWDYVPDYSVPAAGFRDLLEEEARQ